MAEDELVQGDNQDERILALLADSRTFEQGFRLLVGRYGERMYWQIRRIVLTHEDADDVLQNAFVKVYRGIGRFKGESKLFTWLYRIATNEALSFVKQQQKHSTFSLDHPHLGLANQLQADTHFDGSEAEALLHQALATLPERQREVFGLRYFDGMSYKEISALLGLSIGALKASHHHALRKLEEYLGSRAMR